MNEYIHIPMQKGKSNVFEDLGFEPEIATNLKIRADLILDLQRYIQQQSWTQEQSAKFFNETQPLL